MLDPLGDICKAFERRDEGPSLTSARWIVARIDGVGFSKLTKSVTKPYDARIGRAMEASATSVLLKMGALAAYHQSDEISVFWRVDDPEELLYQGRRSKWLSVIAATATSAFVRQLCKENLMAMVDTEPRMDARLCTFDDLEGPASMLAWRAQDARRNAIQGAAQQYFPQRELHKRNLDDLRAKLAAVGTPFDTHYPDALRNGTLLSLRADARRLDETTRLSIPTAHRPDADALFWRRSLVADSTTLPDTIAQAAAFLAACGDDLDAHRARKEAARLAEASVI